ncbi:MAG TPA: Hsp20/alpha crystallin family protein [Bryobacteraceae bacterium]|nr:Hsp20/alpha crystallin family protein [Bryobacteraceae bacterium]
MTFLFSASRQVHEWQPAVDIYRTPEGWLLKFDLAGVRLDDVQVHVSRRSVRVAGVRKDRLEEAGCRHYSMEITYSRFSRTVDLPEEVQGANVSVEYRDGILHVRISAHGSERT